MRPRSLHEAIRRHTGTSTDILADIRHDDIKYGSDFSSIYIIVVVVFCAGGIEPPARTCFQLNLWKVHVTTTPCKLKTPFYALFCNF